MKQRTILFRGKRVDNGEWVEGSLAKMNDGAWIIPQSYDSVAITKDGFGGHTVIGLKEVDPATVGQFTGKEDKNGKKIFTGHRVKVHGHEYDVIFNERMTSFDIATTGNGIGFYDSKDIEIVGTIHDK